MNNFFCLSLDELNIKVHKIGTKQICTFIGYFTIHRYTDKCILDNQSTFLLDRSILDYGSQSLAQAFGKIEIIRCPLLDINVGETLQLLTAMK